MSVVDLMALRTARVVQRREREGGQRATSGCSKRDLLSHVLTTVEQAIDERMADLSVPWLGK
jgi:hypothetical protein